MLHKPSMLHETNFLRRNNNKRETHMSQKS